MAKQVELKEKGTTNVLYPVTTTDCVLRSNGENITYALDRLDGIADNVTIGTDTSIGINGDISSDVTIGEFVDIARSVTIGTKVNIGLETKIGQYDVIGDNVIIGSNLHITNGNTGFSISSAVPTSDGTTIRPLLKVEDDVVEIQSTVSASGKPVVKFSDAGLVVNTNGHSDVIKLGSNCSLGNNINIYQENNNLYVRIGVSTSAKTYRIQMVEVQQVVDGGGAVGQV